MYLKAGEKTQTCIPLMMRCPATFFRAWPSGFLTDCKIKAGTGLAAGAGIGGLPVVGPGCEKGDK